MNLGYRISRSPRFALATLLCILGMLLPLNARAQNTVYFSTASLGTTKSIAQWGNEVAWVNSDNMRQTMSNMGVSNINVIAGNFYLNEALQADGTIGPNSKAAIDAQMQVLQMAGNKPYILGPTVGNTNAYYLNGTALQTDRWAALIKATKQYINTQWNVTVSGVMPFNESDYWTGQGTPQELNTIMTTLRSDSSFNGVSLIGASTLNSNNAQAIYDPASGVADYGSTHVLGGSATTYASFFQHVTALGDKPSAPELHGLGEAIYAAQYGVQQAMWWGAVLQPRGVFVQTSQGQQLGYGENRTNNTAAAVYRAPDGSVRAFAGGFERFGTSTPYRFVSTDHDVYFNGVGPIREYMILANDEVTSDGQDFPAWLLSDQQNSVKTALGSDGVTVGDYTAFGQVKQQAGTGSVHTANMLLTCFTGRPYDEYTGLQNNWHRWYDAALGQWLSEDPLGFAAGDTNLRRYVGNGPTNGIDPSGEIIWFVCIGAAAGYFFTPQPANAPAPGDHVFAPNPNAPIRNGIIGAFIGRSMAMGIVNISGTTPPGPIYDVDPNDPNYDPTLDPHSIWYGRDISVGGPSPKPRIPYDGYDPDGGILYDPTGGIGNDNSTIDLDHPNGLILNSRRLFLHIEHRFYFTS